MTGSSRYEPALRRILWELRPYLDRVVVIGGWVPYLYRRYGGFTSWAAGLSLTAEVDVLVERALPAGNDPTIPEILRASGFRSTDNQAAGAVWLGDVAAGEKVEFLVPHAGTGRGQGGVVPIVPQRGMRAISLPGLELLQRHKQTLRIPLATREGEQELAVWVPLLGAYVVNKGCTFMRRQAHESGPNERRAKDLLYLRDIAAAGREVMEHVAGDLREMRTDKRAVPRMRAAANSVQLAANGSPGSGLTEAASMLREREGLTDARALADLRGHLADLLDLLREALNPPRRDEPRAG